MYKLYGVAWDRDKKELAKEQGPKAKFLLDYQTNYGENFTNPQFHQTFVKQRQQTDRWGRKLLIKPNRKYDKGKHFMAYRYLSTEYMNKVFAISLLEDQDQPDCLIPVNEVDYMLRDASEITPSKPPEIPSMKKNLSEAQKPIGKPLSVPNSIETADDDLVEEDLDKDPFEMAVRHYVEPEMEFVYEPKEFSKNLQRLRLELFARLERSRMLQYILFNSMPPEDEEVPQHLSCKEQERLREEKNIEIGKAKRLKFIAAVEKEENPYKTGDLEVFPAEMFVLKAFFGDIMVNQDFFMFVSFGITVDDVFETAKFKSKQFDIEKSKKKIIYRWQEIEEIMVRPVIGPMIGLEVYTADKKSFSFNLIEKENMRAFMTAVDKIQSYKKYEFNVINDPVKAFKNNLIAENWKTGEKSNQEFLLLLNKYSGRTFNCFWHYPFFPHVLTDYESQLIEFHEQKLLGKVYRDFNRTAINMFEGREVFLDNTIKYFTTFDQGYQLVPTKGPSAYLRTMHQLSRLEPFTSLYLKGNGQTEDPNRVLYSFQDFIGDLKEHDPSIPVTSELLPEHFYLPEIFTNENFINYHGRRDFYKVNKDTWHLPKWALNHHDMIRVMRETLESKYVQENIGAWIDMQFGCDQFKREKYNQFYPQCYPEWWDKESQMYKDWKEQWPKFEDRDEFDEMEVEMNMITFYDTIMNGFQVPLKLMNTPVMQAEKEKPQIVQDPLTSGNQMKSIDDFLEEQDKNLAGGKKNDRLNIDNLINHFVANIDNPQRSELKLNRCADKQDLENWHDIIHMIIISLPKQCLAFLRIEPKPPKEMLPNAVNTGNIVVHCNRVNISKETFGPKKQFDLQLRYEHVHHELDNIFAEFSCKKDKCIYKEKRYLYCGGYLDNTIKIFDLMKPQGEHLVRVLSHNNARVTCIKFSKDYKYFITCDADGVIHHYEKNCHRDTNDHLDVSQALSTTVGASGKPKKESAQSKKEHFPFTLLHTIQDQMDEIVAIDINDTLDMYVTLSRDGTIALRCLRTSKLWKHFKLLYIHNSHKEEKLVQIKGFVKNFNYIKALKLSLHGYIIVCGPSSRQVNVSQYLVYSINGDLLRAALEKVEIKNVFLNSREDQLIIATNFANTPSEKSENAWTNVTGNLRVLNLYGLEKIANLSKVVYIETINFLANDQNDQAPRAPEVQGKQIPSIQCMVVGQAERNMNIFFVKKQIDAEGSNRRGNKQETKEIICFDSGMDAVWAHFKNYGIAR